MSDGFFAERSMEDLTQELLRVNLENQSLTRELAIKERALELHRRLEGTLRIERDQLRHDALGDLALAKEEERAAVVKYLRRMSKSEAIPYAAEAQLRFHADAIEKGEHHGP